MAAAEYETIVVSLEHQVATITLNRPAALNALNQTMMRELTGVAAELDRDQAARVLIITGSERAFAAGADINEMRDRTFSDLHAADWFAEWDSFANLRKPTIAAVAGYALGGGCELAMMCDITLAADTARFGQPEIKLGIPPGIGGSQRLTRAVGKAKAMEMCLTGRSMTADEAERAGLVARVVPASELLAEANRLAQAIAGMSLPATLAIKDCVNRAFESGLAEGLRYERRSFYAAFATADQKIGMTAFLEKRTPDFVDR